MSSQTPEDRVRMTVDAGQYVLFFTFQDIPFAATENNRVTFAKLKDPNDPDQDFRNLAYFQAVNLIEIAKGNQTIKPFDYNDIKDIIIISQDKAKYLSTVA